MPETDQEARLRPDFVRQRRNLLVASLVLVAFLSTGAELSHLNVFGNQIDLKRPLLVSWPLWIAWAYLLWRYYQHLHDLGDLGIRTAWVYKHHGLVGEYAKRSVKRDFHPGDTYGASVQSTFTLSSADVVNYEGGAWFVKVVGHVAYHEGNPVTRSGHQEIDEVVSVSRGLVGVLSFRAAWWVLFHTRLATEYLLPFAIAAVPLILWMAQRWLGFSLAA